MPEGLTRGIAGIPLGFSTGGIYQDPTPLVTNRAARGLLSDFDGDPDSHSEPLDPVSKTSFDVANAVFTGFGLAFPALAPVAFPFMVARHYMEEEEPDLAQFGIDPLGQFTGIGGPAGADDTSVGANEDAAVAAANAAAAAVGFDVVDTEMAAEMSTDDTGGPPGGGDPEADVWHLGGFVDTGSQGGGVASLRLGANALPDYVRSKLSLSNLTPFQMGGIASLKTGAGALQDYVRSKLSSGIGGHGSVLGSFS